MIYTPMTKQALQTCFDAHKNQTDKTGLPLYSIRFILQSKCRMRIPPLLHCSTM